MRGVVPRLVARGHVAADLAQNLPTGVSTDQTRETGRTRRKRESSVSWSALTVPVARNCRSSSCVSAAHPARRQPHSLSVHTRARRAPAMALLTWALNCLP
jgi:hypothetical protein